MSTLVLGAMDAIAPSAQTKTPGLFARFVESREMQASRRMVAYLAAQSDERLTGLGFGPAEIVALGRGELKLPVR